MTNGNTAFTRRERPGRPASPLPGRTPKTADSFTKSSSHSREQFILSCAQLCPLGAGVFRHGSSTLYKTGQHSGAAFPCCGTAGSTPANWQEGQQHHLRITVALSDALSKSPRRARRVSAYGVIRGNPLAPSPHPSTKYEGIIRGSTGTGRETMVMCAHPGPPARCKGASYNRAGARSAGTPAPAQHTAPLSGVMLYCPIRLANQHVAKRKERTCHA